MRDTTDSKGPAQAAGLNKNGTYEQGFFAGMNHESTRIRAALLQVCGEMFGGGCACLLPRGHIGGHYWASDYDPATNNPTIAVTRARLEEVLNG